MKWMSIPLITCLLAPAGLLSQGMVDNQEKYWEYRNRMLEGFIVVGEGAGKSIPSGGKDDEAHYITWGDATIDLGWYMCILATEYHLLNNNGIVRTESEHVIQKEKTLQEIYYALKAIERLDSVAEPFFNPKLPPEINGFFVRDDVPRSLIEKLPNKRHMVSDFTAETISNNEESQDQVYHIVMGLMSIHRFIPPATQYNGMLLSAKSKEIALRIIDWNRLNGWKIVNPAEPDAKGRPTPVERGSESYIYSSGTMKTRAQFVDDEAKSAKVKSKLNPLNKLYWSTLRMGINPTYIKADNKHMALAVIATGNGFRKVTYRKLAKKSFKNDWYVYPLLNKALYPSNRNYRKDEELMENSLQLLNTAPFEGIVSPSPGRSETGWSRNNRFLRKKEALHNPPDYQKGLEFAGYDYMLLHNLYLIHKRELLLERREKSQ